MELSSRKDTQSQVAIQKSRVSWDIATKKFNFKYCRKLLNSNSDRVSILKPIKMQRKTTTCYKFLVLLYFCTIPLHNNKPQKRAAAAAVMEFDTLRSGV